MNAEMQMLQALLGGGMNGMGDVAYLLFLGVVWLYKPEKVMSPALFRASWRCFLLASIVTLVVQGLLQSAATIGIGGPGGGGMGMGNDVLGMVFMGSKHVSDALKVAAFACLFACLAPPVGKQAARHDGAVRPES